MSSNLQYLLLGLGGGAVLAALAMGLLLTYRASGVVNFAHAAMGMFIALNYFSLRESGALLNPLPFGPDRIPLAPGASTLADGTIELYRFKMGTALPLALVYAALLGLVVYWLVFRPLRAAPTLARIAASLGLFLYFLAIARLRTGAQGAALGHHDPILPNGVVTGAGITIQQDRIWLTLLVIAVTCALAALYHFSRFGLATRAAAESEKGAVLVGLSPTRLAAVNWMLGAMLAGGAVILIAPISGLDPTTTSLLVVPALAAALIGKFKSFTVTMLAGLAIGMAQSELLNISTQVEIFRNLNLQQALPFLIIILTMVFRGESLPSRATLRESHFPRSTRPAHLPFWVALLGGAALVGTFTLDSGWRQAIIITCTTAVIALSVVLLTGYVGQISLMPLALAGLAGFVMAKLQNDYGIPFPLAPLLASLAAVAAGLLAGIPAVRVRGMNLAIATIAAATAIEELILKLPALAPAGGTTVPPPVIGPFNLGIQAPGADFPRRPFVVLCIVVLTLCAMAVANIRRSSTGVRFLAVRANERAAASAGIDVTRTKLLAFALSSFLAGIGGCLYAYAHPNLSNSSFAVFNSLALLAAVYLGGIASVGGALLAGVFADGGLLSAATGGESSPTQFAIQGIVLIIVAIVYPEGITGALYSLSARIRSKLGWSTPPDALAISTDTDDAPRQSTADTSKIAAVKG